MLVQFPYKIATLGHLPFSDKPIWSTKTPSLGRKNRMPAMKFLWRQASRRAVHIRICLKISPWKSAAIHWGTKVQAHFEQSRQYCLFQCLKIQSRQSRHSLGKRSTDLCISRHGYGWKLLTKLDDVGWLTWFHTQNKLLLVSIGAPNLSSHTSLCAWVWIFQDLHATVHLHLLQMNLKIPSGNLAIENGDL